MKKTTMKKPSRAVAHGKRQSTRLAFSRVDEEETEDEDMEVSDRIRSFVSYTVNRF